MSTTSKVPQFAERRLRHPVLKAGARTLSLFVASLLWFPGVPPNAHADPSCDYIVVGTGDPGIDAPALQAAISGPHASDTVTVCVSGTLVFDSTTAFPGRFNVLVNPTSPSGPTSELNLVGLWGPDGKATIVGGFNTLVVPASVPGGPNEVGRIRISHLRFKDAASSAILVFRVNELLEIRDVDVEGVVSAEIVLPSGAIFVSRVGINITAFPADQNSHVTGVVRIEGTRVDGGTYDDPSVDAFIINPAGIGVFGFPQRAIEAQVTVIDNRTSNWSGSGIAVNYANDVLVAGNSIRTGGFANDLSLAPAPGPSLCAAPNGLASAGGISVVGSGSIAVADNAIEMEEARTASGALTPCAAGVLVVNGSGAVVEDVRVYGAGNAKGVVVVNGTQIAVRDVGVRGAGVGLSVQSGASIDFEDISIRGAQLCTDVDANSVAVTFEDVTCK